MALVCRVGGLDSSVLADFGCSLSTRALGSLAVKSSYLHMLLAGVLLPVVVPLVGISRHLLLYRAFTSRGSGI